jgi:hypothetical protein
VTGELRIDPIRLVHERADPTALGADENRDPSYAGDVESTQRFMTSLVLAHRLEKVLR